MFACDSVRKLKCINSIQVFLNPLIPNMKIQILPYISYSSNEKMVKH